MGKNDDSVGSKLKALRISLDLKQQEVADGSGITNAALCLIESGKRLPGFAVLKSLCEFFGVSADYLLGLNWEITSLADQIAIESKRCIDTYDLKDLASYYDVEDEECVRKLDALLMEYMHMRGLNDK